MEVLAAILDFYGDTVSDHINNHSIGFLVHENLGIEPNMKSLAQILTELWPF